MKVMPSGTSDVKINVTDGDNVTLPCSLTTKEDLGKALFDWKKGRQEIYVYSGGSYYGNGHTGQDEQYKGRVSHFEEQLQFGNASILIRDTQVDDSGVYTCVFPHLLPGRKFNIELVVVPTFRNRYPLIPVAAPQPFVGILDVTDDGVLLQCVVRGAHPLPELQWQAANGSVIPAEVPQVSERRGRYDVTLIATVTEPGIFRCVVKQKDLYHEIHDDITVPERLFESSPCIGLFIGGLFSGFVTSAVVALLVFFIIKRRKNDSHQQQKSSEEEDEKTRLQTFPENVNGSPENHNKTPNGSGRLGNGCAEDSV